MHFGGIYERTRLFLTILSAIIFGFTPILAKITYNIGSNGITLAF